MMTALSTAIEASDEDFAARFSALRTALSHFEPERASATIEKIEAVSAMGMLPIPVDTFWQVTLRAPDRYEWEAVQSLKKALARASGWLIQWAHSGEMKP